MAKSGDWGGNPGAIKGTVKRTANVTKNATVSRGEAMPIQGEVAKLKYYPEPNYRREPFDPDFQRRAAKGTDRVKGQR